MFYYNIINYNCEDVIYGKLIRNEYCLGVYVILMFIYIYNVKVFYLYFIGEYFFFIFINYMKLIVFNNFKYYLYW